MIDVLIAGGGPAGSTLAILLGRAGLRVELYEQAQFPREKPCGEGLMPAGVAVLERLGLADAVGGEPFAGIRYHFGGRTVEGRFPARNGTRVLGRAQRRRHLDKVLFDAAAATPGVCACVGAAVQAPLCENGRVAGLLVAGTVRRARLVVAADGVHSRLRRALGLTLRAPRPRFGARAHFRLAAGQAPSPWVDVFAGQGHELYVAALPGGELLVAALADGEVLHGKIEETYARWLRAWPELRWRLDGARQISPLLCDSALGARARCGVAPGAVLLGDAAGSMDPITGGGITHALVTAELLASYLTHGVPAGDAWLAEFEQRRRAMLRDYRALTRMVLWLAEHPRGARHLVRLLDRAPGAMSHLIGVAGGVRPLLGLAWH
jgi:2-polyprenyl-6-methoxyphenol hydroxylase-like FAD-dependent oxidoreductase